MKKIIILASLLMAVGCMQPQMASQQMDPCNQMTFNAQACQMAMGAGGYNYGGMWYPMVYSHPYNYYYGGYHTYIVHGGVVRTIPVTSYSTIHTSTTRVYSSPGRTSTTYSSPGRTSTTYSSPGRSSSSYHSSYSSPGRSSSSFSSGRRR